MNKDEIIRINQERIKILETPYNPLSGEGSFSCKRKVLKISDCQFPTLYVPEPMFKEELVVLLQKTGSFAKAAKVLQETDDNITADDVALAFVRVRIKYDFEFWAYSFIFIKPKATVKRKKKKRGRKKSAKTNTSKNGLIPFLLNRGQRKYLKYLLDDFFAGVPIRIILLKARQWGGSTLTQFFMMWIQLVHVKQWNSVICAHVENTARIVRGMYTKALKQYPYILDDEADRVMTMSPYEGSSKTREVSFRECTISIGSAEKPEGLRGEDCSMAHFSEVASFKATEGKKPEDLIQSIVGGIPPVDKTMIVYESTAKGVGNFFHREWINAKKGESGFKPVFIAWFDIENYAADIDDYDTFINSLTKEEMLLFESGATLENIAWYRIKSKEFSDKWRFVSEYPSNDIEAFQSTGARYFNINDVARLRKTCCEPAMVGDIISDAEFGDKALCNIKFKSNPKEGKMKIWALPDGVKMTNNRYVVVVDVNRGTSKDADNGIICVFDRYWMGAEMDGKPEVVAEWAGHILMRYFIWIAAKIAKLYDNAHLVIESNTPDSVAQNDGTKESLLDEIGRSYTNMYYREGSPENIKDEKPKKWGFNTNRSTKFKICTNQQLVIANDMYIERCIDAVDEHDTFEVKENGSLGAVEGCHDDRVITRALGNWICYNLPPPVLVNEKKKRFKINNKVVNESSM